MLARSNLDVIVPPSHHREVLARVLKLGLENPQMTAQVYNAIAESILQDSRNVGAARQSLQLALKSSTALHDLPSLITTLRLSSRTCTARACAHDSLLTR
jgi:hypothetical protein